MECPGTNIGRTEMHGKFMGIFQTMTGVCQIKLLQRGRFAAGTQTTMNAEAQRRWVNVLAFPKGLLWESQNKYIATWIKQLIPYFNLDK